MEAVVKSRELTETRMMQVCCLLISCIFFYILSVAIQQNLRLY